MAGTRGGYSAISSFSRVEVLHLIQSHPRRTVAELAEATGLHPNTVREHLARLLDAGHIVRETEHRTTRGRPRVLYSAATGQGESSSPIARRKAREAAARGDLMRRVMPWTGVSAEDLGTDATHQLDAIIDHLGESGFDPLIDESVLTIDLSPCPHATAQADHRDTLCSVHLGIMQGVLTEAGGPLLVDGMRPSCNPEDCVVQLTTR
ncbi:winged helix-turn-helix transcriptional regulator [Microbacterium limosum]|uniref:Winged helix-turn-helix transcriptional regulator n=1 Tax=Microbacterium limosum TaxID=3079935 RepID=A0AAU0MJ72_9MICO|nr:winged helix-turn-helix transcriptional regulator [Microbacterium sp. Y20]WOQ70215.1 winged helix-turn-helix transcriptional regulator [Microbacterium sp. Y20]